MTADDLPWDEPATLIWLFPGDNLDEPDFKDEWIGDPPEQNPHEFGTFREAVQFANTADCAHGKGAWVTVGERILNPVDVWEAYKAHAASL